MGAAESASFDTVSETIQTNHYEERSTGAEMWHSLEIAQ